MCGKQWQSQSLVKATQEEVDIERSLITGNQAVLCSADTGHSEKLVQHSGYSGESKAAQIKVTSLKDSVKHRLMTLL